MVTDTFLCCYSACTLSFTCRGMDNGDFLSCTAGGYMWSFTYWCLLYCLAVKICMWRFSPSVLSTDQLMHRSVNILSSALGFIYLFFSSLFLSHTCLVIMLFWKKISYVFMNYFGKTLQYKYCRLTAIMLSDFGAMHNLGATQSAALLFYMSSYFQLLCLHGFPAETLGIYSTLHLWQSNSN